MKTKTNLLFLLFLSHAAFAKPKAYLTEATQVSRLISSKVFSIDGVSSIGLTSCQHRTGQISSDGDVYCILVTVASKYSAAQLSKLYPSGTRIHGINFWIQIRGEAKPQPRMSGGG